MSFQRASSLPKVARPAERQGRAGQNSEARGHGEGAASSRGSARESAAAPQTKAAASTATAWYAKWSATHENRIG